MGELFDPQAALLELIEHSSFNNFDGKRVRDDLVKHRNLWKSCIMTRVGIGVTLRDLPDGFYNVDALYILAAPGRAKDLAFVIAKWGADDVRRLEGKEADSFLGQGGIGTETVFEIWWD